MPASRRRVDTYPLANPILSSCADQQYNMAATKQCTHRVDGPVVDLCLLPGHRTLSLGAAALKHIPEHIPQDELGTIRIGYEFLEIGFWKEKVENVTRGGR